MLTEAKRPEIYAFTALNEKLVLKASGDGSTHINVYSLGATELGRKLTNFAKTPFTHPVYGKFESMEGYWHYLSTGMIHNLLKSKYGNEAKVSARRLAKVWYPEFESEIIQGLHCKLSQNPDIYTMLMQSTLPLTHYYIFAGAMKDAVKPNLFWMRELEDIRNGKPLMY